MNSIAHQKGLMLMLPALPKNFVIRPARFDDVEVVAQVSNDLSDAIGGETHINATRLLSFWKMPGTNLDNDARVVLEPNGQIVGYVLTRSEEDSRFEASGVVHPDYRGRGIGRRLIAESEARVEMALADIPADIPVTLRHGINHADGAAATLISDMGYQMVRHFVQMGIRLDSPPPTPESLPGITIRPLGPDGDLRAVYEAAGEAFRDHWEPHQFTFEQWLHFRAKRKDFDPSLWFLAMDGDEIAGTTLGYPNRDDDPTFGWISEVTVRRPWRKRGIGLALMYTAFGEFYRRGFARVGLNVDGENPTGAKRLYERAGMSAVSQMDFYRKTIREGVGGE